MNVVILTGNLVDVPQIKNYNGVVVGEFTLAVDSYFKTEKRTSYFQVTTFGNTAENAFKYLGRGSKVAITGHLKQERWEAEGGAKMSAIKVVAEKVEYLSTNPNKAKEMEKLDVSMAVS
jgi:single-strand DNA-binding protein